MIPNASAALETVGDDCRSRWCSASTSEIRAMPKTMKMAMYQTTRAASLPATNAADSPGDGLPVM